MGPEDHKDDDEEKMTVIRMIDVKPKCRTSKMGGDLESRTSGTSHH